MVEHQGELSKCEFQSVVYLSRLHQVALNRVRLKIRCRATEQLISVIQHHTASN